MIVNDCSKLLIDYYRLLTGTVIIYFFYSCSICTIKQNRHFIVPASSFTLLQGEEELTTYTFGTNQAKHRVILIDISKRKDVFYWIFIFKFTSHHCLFVLCDAPSSAKRVESKASTFHDPIQMESASRLITCTTNEFFFITIFSSQCLFVFNCRCNAALYRPRYYNGNHNQEI